jgi:hypothetical protein
MILYITSAKALYKNKKIINEKMLYIIILASGHISTFYRIILNPPSTTSLSKAVMLKRYSPNHYFGPNKLYEFSEKKGPVHH